MVHKGVPRVINIRRRRGVPWQTFDCYIGRAVKKGGWNLEASIWANPFKVELGRPPGSALSAYEQHVRSNPALMHQIPSLMGKTPGCWYKPNPCHGDVLMKLVQEYLETSEDFEELPDIDGASDAESELDSNNNVKHTDTATPAMQHSTEGVTIGTVYLKRSCVSVVAILCAVFDSPHSFI